MKYILFGTGDYYNRYKKWFDDKHVVALIDNSKKKQNTVIDGHIVISPEEVLNIEYDIIVILSFYVKQMKQQLLDLGIMENKIYHFFQLHDLFKDDYKKKDKMVYKIDNYDEMGNKKALLISHDLSLGGPALALMNAAIAIKNMGFDVTYTSMIDGPLAQNIVEQGIRIVVDENLQIQTLSESDWNEGFDLIICNTISMYVLLSERNMGIPTIWWLHDSRQYYDGVDRERICGINRKNLAVVAVSAIPKNAIQEFIYDLNVGNLVYATPEVSGNIIKRLDKKSLSFITIGFIEPHKGQDLLVGAIKNIPNDILSECEFTFVGKNTSLYAQELMIQVKNVPEIRVVGSVDRNKIHELIEDADVLICPSRQDSMPTVCAEAMMHSKPCLISDGTGTVNYIEDEVNGLIFESENVEQLSAKIIWCYKNKDKLTEMGIEAYKVYKEVFSKEAFEKNIRELVTKVMIDNNVK